MRGMPLTVSTSDPLSYATSLTNPRRCFNSNTASLLYFKKTRRRRGCHAWVDHIQRIGRAKWRRRWVHPTPCSYALSLTHPRQLFNPDAASPVFQEMQRQLSLTLTYGWPCRMTKTVSTPHPLSYASSLTHPRRRFNPDAASPVFQGKRCQLSPTLT